MPSGTAHCIRQLDQQLTLRLPGGRAAPGLNFGGAQTSSVSGHSCARLAIETVPIERAAYRPQKDDAQSTPFPIVLIGVWAQSDSSASPSGK